MYIVSHIVLTNHWQRDLIPFWYVVSCVAKVLSRLAVVIGPQGYNWDIFGVTLFYATNALMICLIFDYSPLA